MNKQTTMSGFEKNTGLLEIFVGPMFSGKTSKLLEIYKQCNFCNIPVCVINHSDDDRYHETLMSTHDKDMIPCIQTNSISRLWDHSNLEQSYDSICDKHMQLHTAEVILINEAQFFDDLYECVVSMLNANKKVYISGLDGDFERKKFGQILDLIPLCDKITKLKSLCSLCKNGTNGIFSLRLSKERQQTLIGSNNYIPVCRSCYNSSYVQDEKDTDVEANHYINNMLYAEL
jgi:thymidine kinase